MLVGRQRFILEGFFAHKRSAGSIKDVTTVAYMLQGSGCSDTEILRSEFSIVFGSPVRSPRVQQLIVHNQYM